ncbi:hypothetical protein OU149_002524, partial [Enterococcus faecalis]|nr:hypothetical protein [Enterococcus faecalis]ELT8948174.1 hypothetical protein [Enterococcus faecalis]
DNDLNNMFPVLVEFIQVLWALELYEEHENISSEVKNFLTKIRIVYLRLLYVYPLNDDFIVEAILRQISENVLKTLFLIETPGKNIEEVTKMSYRALWDTNLKKSNMYVNYKKELDYFNNLFKIGSDILHAKYEIDGVKQLSDRYENNTPYDYQKIRKLNKNLKHFLFNIIEESFFINESENFTINQKNRKKQCLAKISKKDIMKKISK